MRLTAEVIELLDRGLTMRARELLVGSRAPCARCGASWPVSRDTVNEPFKHCPNCEVRK